MFDNMQDIRSIGEKHYLISTVNLRFISGGFETMIFRCGEEGNILTGIPLYEERCETFIWAMNRHKKDQGNERQGIYGID